MKVKHWIRMKIRKFLYPEEKYYIGADYSIPPEYSCVLIIRVRNNKIEVIGEHFNKSGYFADFEKEVVRLAKIYNGQIIRDLPPDIERFFK